MIQARRNDAVSQNLKHSWWDDDDGLLRQRMKGARMSWKLLFSKHHGRTMAEIKLRI
jgi:hypothetical protein